LEEYQKQEFKYARKALNNQYPFVHLEHDVMVEAIEPPCFKSLNELGINNETLERKDLSFWIMRKKLEMETFHKCN
jgi:hypothetical protein